MKKLAVLFLIFSLTCQAQNHVDIFKFNFGESFKNNFKDTLSTHIYSMDAELTLPFKINQKHAVITGIDYSRNSLQLFPESSFSKLQSTTLKLGLASQWNDKWSSAVVLFPKIASDYKDISSKDFYLGLIATAKMKKTENFSWRFGIYASTEAYGVFTTPILGWQYQSPNEKFEMDMSLPIKGDMNYKLGVVSIGADYYGISRSFRFQDDDKQKFYADLNSIKLSAYLQWNTFNESLLLRAKLGYSSDNYSVYNENQKIGLGLSAFKFGDNRTQLNPDLQGSPFFKIEAVYRFQVKSKN